jgi:alkylation response protein AidB-like acyl-CoA dehydrogenase
VGLSVAATTACARATSYFGNEEQKRALATQAGHRPMAGRLGLTEPNTGSDAMRMKCTARKEGKEWVLNGTKNWITHGISSDVWW